MNRSEAEKQARWSELLTDSVSPIPLGPFELHRPIGRGGMGEVWLGRHTGQDLPVAIKVITRDEVRHGRFIRAFRNEIRAVAGLSHPGIVMVFDNGKITKDAEQLSGGRLKSGSPYLVMEYLPGGALSHARPPQDWGEVKAILLEILGALAHAHARGVIHRDLKPNNVLLTRDSDELSGLKIIDFGLAATWSHEAGEGAEFNAGTPAYEPPEKLLGRVRDQGPWTDLYSLGCIAYGLAAGHPPFAGDSDQLARCHLLVPVPALRNRIAIPRGLEAWIRRLLTKHPNDRFRRAADAAFALQTLDESELLPVVDFENDESRADGDEEQTPNTAPYTVPLTLPSVRYEEPELPVDALEGAAPVRIPPLSDDWREDASTDAARSMKLVGAGLGLYGVRCLPLVNRIEERDTLWASLARVSRTGRAEAVLLSGEAGNGKTKLVEWFTEKVHEFGAASSVLATHGPIRDPKDGLRRLVTRHFSCVGLSRKDSLERIESALREAGVSRPYEWHALTEIVSPATGKDIAAGATSVRFRTPGARYAPVRRMIERLATERPVVVWLEDVQWGAEAIGFTRHVLKYQSRSPCPVLFVMTLRDDAFEADSVEYGMLDDVMAMKATSQFRLDPLEPADCSTLVQGLLGLEGELATQVETRSGGNPLFAVQLVGDWVQRGVLEVGESGFVLREGESAVIPDDIHELWEGRIQRILQDDSQDALLALELAAALGRDVDTKEWMAVCKLAGTPFSETLVDRLVAQRLAQPTEVGWSVVHGMLRESLRRTAIEAGRWEQHHSVCAQLMRRYSRDNQGVSERLGRHLLAAKEYEQAIDPLLEGARAREDASEYRTGRALLADREHALHMADVLPSDKRWGDGYMLLAAIHSVQGKYDQANAIASRTLKLAEKWGWDEIAAEALATTGYVAHQHGDFDSAVESYERALKMYLEQEHRIGEANCLVRLGQVARLTADLDRAAELLQDAIEIFRDLDDRRGISMCLRNLGVVAQHSGDVVSATDLMERGMALYDAVGNQYGVAICMNDLAEVARIRGSLEKAENGYRQALAIFHDVGSTDGVIAQLNLGLILILRGAFAEAESVLLETEQLLDKDGRRWFLGALHTALLPCSADRADWDSWNHHIKLANQLLTDTGIVDGDLAWTLELGADKALEHGETERALDAYRIAKAQWTSLGDQPKVDSIVAQIRAVEKGA